MNSVLFALGFILISPFIGGLITGIDRKITARMQGRVGPPLLQPFYDVGKLFEKELVVVTEMQIIYVIFYLVFIILTGALFAAGVDLLLVIFALTLAHVFLILGAMTQYSPYSFIGAERELLQILAYEPMVILTAVGLYMATGSFKVSEICESETLTILLLPGIFIGFVTIMSIKLRKSPFDLSTSHHAHQEIVKGVTTEYSGPSLGLIEIAHWYELVLLLGILSLFFAFNLWISIAAVSLIYLFEILLDNVTARMRWQYMITITWGLTAVLSLINLTILGYYSQGM